MYIDPQSESVENRHAAKTAEAYPEFFIYGVSGLDSAGIEIEISELYSFRHSCCSAGIKYDRSPVFLIFGRKKLFGPACP